MDIKDIGFAQLSAEQVDALKKYENEFSNKYGNNVYFLAFNKK